MRTDKAAHRSTTTIRPNQLPDIKQARLDVAGVHSQVLQDTLRRVQKAFDNFFRRVKAGEKPSYPRFQGRDRYDSFTFPQGGWKLDGKKLTLSKIGSCLLILNRPIAGTIKTVTIKREADGWYVSFSVECDARHSKNVSARLGGCRLGKLRHAQPRSDNCEPTTFAASRATLEDGTAQLGAQKA